MNTSEHVLYIGSYADANQPGIYAGTFDDAANELTVRAAFVGIANPSFLVSHPNGRWLYAVSESNQQQDGVPGAVWAFRCTQKPWSIEPINSQMSGGDGPCHLAIDSTGRWLLVCNFGSGTVGVLPILAEGALGEMTDLIRHSGSGPLPRQQGPHAHSATFTPDQRFAIVADLGMDALLVYRFDPSVGRLQEHTRTLTRPGAGPRHLAFHPSGQHVYVANEIGCSVAVYDYDATNGRLRERQIVGTLPPSAPESYVADIHLSPLGNRVYVSNRGGHDSIAIFAVEADGRLALAAIRPCGGHWPRNFAIAPGGGFLLVANEHSNEVVMLPALSSSEELGAPIAHAIITRASCVHFHEEAEV